MIHTIDRPNRHKTKIKTKKNFFYSNLYGNLSNSQITNIVRFFDLEMRSKWCSHLPLIVSIVIPIISRYTNGNECEINIDDVVLYFGQLLGL